MLLENFQFIILYKSNILQTVNFPITYTVLCAIGWYGNSLGFNIFDVNVVSIDLNIWNAFGVIDRTKIKRLVFTVTAFHFCTVNRDICWHSD